jgi:hypothetical protein
MKTTRALSVLFAIAAIYDGVLGLAFIVAGPSLFEWFEVTPPNHFGYVQFPALLLVVFAVMFAAIARDPVGKRNLIPYGIGLKIAYCLVVFYYWILATIPGMWKPFAVLDLMFLVLFAWAYVTLGRESGLATT